MPIASLTEMLFKLSFERWEAIFMALLPAILNIYILIYIFKRLDRNALTFTFAIAVCSLAIWQFSDVIMRMSTNLTTAQIWRDLLWPLTLLVVPAGMHFALLFTEKKKIARSPWILTLLYFPLIFFELTAHAGFLHHNIDLNPFWGWILGTTDNLLGIIELLWIALLSTLIFVTLGVYAFQTRHHPVKRIQSLLIAIGFAIPTVQGIITQIVFPYVLQIPEVPVTSTFMTSFSLVTLIALQRYHLFSFNPSYSAGKIIENMNDGLCAVNPEHRIRFVNERFMDLTGYDKKELMDRPFQTFLDEKNRHKYKILQNGNSKRESSKKYFRLIKKSGDSLEVMISDSPIFKRSGELNGAIIIITDVTQIIEAEQKFKQKNIELSNFIYRTSHDLRAPLTSVMGITSMAREEIHSVEDAIRFLEMIDETNVKLDRILFKLKDVGEIIRKKIEYEPIDPHSLVKRVKSELTGLPAYQKVEIREETDPDPFYSDPVLIEISIRKLLENALEYHNLNKLAPLIVISYHKKEGMVKWVVSDNGQGIDPEFIPVATHMFTRGTNDSTGAGLGLYIVKIAMDRLGGEIDCKSELGKGTTITLSFPEKGEK